MELKFALTFLAALIVTTHVPVPEHPSPLQPVNCEFGPGVAVSVTTVFWGIWAVQVDPQSMLLSSLVTDAMPEAEPVLVTVSGNVTPAKFAVTERAMLMLTVHGPVPGQLKPASALFQPRNVFPEVARGREGDVDARREVRLRARSRPRCR